MISRAPPSRRGDVLARLPLDMDLYDWSEDEQVRNQAYCRELEQRLLDYELDPKNFFRIGRPGQGIVGISR